MEQDEYRNTRDTKRPYVYFPTSDQVEKDEKVVQEVYKAIEKLIKTFQNTSASITLIAGYFNAKIGKRRVGEGWKST